MRFFLKHPRFWGDLFTVVAVVGSNIGSAWAGMVSNAISLRSPLETAFPPNVGFQILGWTVYPLAIALLALGVYIRSRYRKS